MKTAVNIRRGSALLLVMWALFLISAAVLAFATYIQQDIKLHAQGNRDLDAIAMAHSGLALALHPMVSQMTPVLEEEFPGGLGFRVRIVSEGGKLNIKWLLEGEDPRKLTMLKQWLERRGLTYDEREQLVDNLLDWVDPDSDHRINGVEEDGEYKAANRMFETVDEIAQVRGAGPLLATEGWRDELTLDSNGPIDVLSAEPDTLRLLPGFGEAAIARFVQFRRGKDALDGTIDDNVFKSLEDVRVFIGLNKPQFQEIGGLATVKDPTMRITSEGIAANVIRQVEVVVRKSGSNPQILSWKE